MFMIASIIQNSAVVVALHLCGNPLEISMETKHFAAALSLFYKGVPESLIRSMLFHLSKATRNVSLELNEVSRIVLSCSCIPASVKPIIQCPNCHHWQFTNHVFCPICSSKEDCVWSRCRLISCRCKSCKAGMHALDQTDEIKRNAVCSHLSKKFLAPHVYYIPTEAFIADLINCGLGIESIGIEESDIVEMANSAASLQFHNILLSKNALGIYEVMGWKNAVKAVNEHLSVMQKTDSVATLASCLDSIEQRCRDASIHLGGSFLIITSVLDYDKETSCIMTERNRSYCNIENVKKHRLSFREFSRNHKKKEDAQRASQVTVTQSVTQSVEQPVAQPVAQSVTQPVTQPVAQSVEQSVEQPVAQSVAQSVEQPVAQSVAQSVTQPVAQSVEQPVAQSVTQSVTQPVAQSVEQPVESTNSGRGKRHIKPTIVFI